MHLICLKIHHINYGLILKKRQIVTLFVNNNQSQIKDQINSQGALRHFSVVINKSGDWVMGLFGLEGSGILGKNKE